MRIIGGRHRGRRLFVPRGLDIRPTSDRVRESIFNILGGAVSAWNVLDLFAGTGALGLEALSRGAAHAVFVDKHPSALAAIRRNVERLGMVSSARVIKADLTRGLGLRKHEQKAYDLIFLDPPYGKGLVLKGLDVVARAGLASSNVLAVAEHASHEEFGRIKTTWVLTEQRTYGQTGVSFFKLAVNK